ncbi:hypothetical protein FGIG_01441 [Fasciola gigantica]|uniref:Uncharacterized protein n=1 Tax=Fasciola gigantica TaxID=46835 RepID=A0A504YJE2_FASGI|nr:hypothetical protein FGIG_01441 [Fasciola gigantica]
MLSLLVNFTIATSHCTFPRFLADHAPNPNLWWTDFGLQHSITSQFVISNKLRRALGHEPFDMNTAQYGWNQLAFNSASGQLQLLQLCPTNEFRASSFRPILSALNRFAQTKCADTRNSIHHGRDSGKSHQSRVSLLRINITCVDQIVQHDAEKFVVHITDYLHQPVYQCLWFEQVNAESAKNVFELHQSEQISYVVDASLCHSRFRSSEPVLWMRFPISGDILERPSCTLVGGFQIRHVIDLSTKRPTCDFKLYASLQVECLFGEGAEWSFSGPNCNPFGRNYVTRFSCHSTWKEDGLRRTLLYRRLNTHVHQVYQMIYEDEPVKADPMSTTYPNFTNLWLRPGLERAFLTEQWHDGAWSSEAVPTSSKPDPAAYMVEIRRAFGVCDDEQEACAQGCEYDAKNQFFCHRTCLAQSQTCELPLRDSCKFRSVYEGAWNLIKQNSDSSMTTPWTHSSKLVRRQMQYQLQVQEGKLILTFRGPHEDVSLDCVHEIHEALQDFYIVRMNHQDNGCHARDLCLEFIQGQKSGLVGTQSSRSVIYRMTPSQKRDTPFKDVCNFDFTHLPAMNVFQNVRPLVLIRKMNNSAEDPGSKCGMYQLGIEGMAHLLRQSQSDISRGTSKNEQGFRKEMFRRGDYTSFASLDNRSNPLHLDHWNSSVYPGWFEEPLFLQYYRTVPTCRVEMTDFNTDLGSTGEFDNKLRLYFTCDGSYAPFLQLTEFLCISSHTLETVSPTFSRHSMLITYSAVLDQYFCWLIKSTIQNNSQLFVLILFPSPQCLYEWSSFGDVQFDPSQALAIFFMQPGKRTCSTCHESGVPQSRGITRIAAPKQPVSPVSELRGKPGQVASFWPHKWKRTTENTSKNGQSSLQYPCGVCLIVIGLFFIILFSSLSVAS